MKLNIDKLQLGGLIYYQSITNPLANQLTKQTQTASDTDDELIPKQILAKLTEKGNPNDVNKFMAILSNFEKKSNFGFGVNKSELYELYAYANQVIKQSLYMDTAEKRAEDNGSLDEYAVDQRGYLYTIGEKGDIKKVHASKFDHEKDLALTVGELIQQRKFNMNEVDNESITTVIGNNIGVEKINEYLFKIIQAVGSTSNSEEAYQDLATILGNEAAKKPTEKQLNSVKNLYNLVLKLGPDAIFKLKESSEGKNIQEAMSYILNMLPNNMRTQLIARNVAAGGEYENSNKYAFEIIASALNASDVIKTTKGIDFDSGINAYYTKKTSGTGTEKEQNRNLNTLEQLVQGSLGKQEYKIISKYNPSVSMTLQGTGIGSLADFDNNIISKTPLSVAMQHSLAPLIDLNHMSMGDQKITAGLLDTILYDGGQVLNIWAPVDSSGDIDLSGLQKFSEIQKTIKYNPQLTIEDKNKLLLENGLDGYFDQQGEFHGTGNMSQFIVMTGLTSDEVIDPETNIFSEKVSKQQKDLELKQIDRIYGQLNKNIKNKNGKYEFVKGWFDWSTDLVKAPIFLKLNKTAQIDVGTFSNKGPMVKTPTYQEQLAYDQIRNASQAKLIITPSTQALYGNE